MSLCSTALFPFWCAEKFSVSTGAHRRSNASPSRSRRPSRLCFAPSLLPLLLLFLALFSQFDFTVEFFTERNSYHHLLRDKRRTVLTSPLPFSQVSLAATNCKNEHEESPTISPYSSPWLEHDFDKNGSSGSLSVSQHFITISYEGASCQIPIASSSSSPGETILAALERHQLYLQRQLGIPELSSDCRRGNCLTCAALVITDRPQNGEARAMYAEKDDNGGKDSAVPRVISSANGLSPYMAKQVQDAGYI